ncbi:homoprotocatechuate catabolism bifunctional isomerase/decarboxylase [Paraphaeosphaeria sporulosa]|uniref:Homoprotocatechuate catabolism bifunctional isomerase/decarboxylase n=1 Tax=Paraphaeosphaeria sporulosa TaxID=1460663 RepID=A0A177CYT5_9PLEO|nr:homoprotocatechuate catabolism bifunctional isomerase/decarboxylase [Paraphaeosphaeria sporulosa]OAG12436.1 homoprotocatechuate catabolism bifunctional isomerase/decarboxylase [Paraphaeosphaeria sporulosa]
MAIPSFTRLVRFVPKSDTSKIYIGEPESDTVDVGVALREGQQVSAFLWSGSSVLSPGTKTGYSEIIGQLLSPVAATEVGTIRCIGLNYVQHAKELAVELPTVPTVFLKPSTALGDPWPARTVLPALTQKSDTGDYESELAIVLGKDCKNVSEEEGLDYVLGYTACNDISSRASQFAQSQWCFSKGFDGSCPIGPTIVSKSLIPDPSTLRIRGLKNGDVKQDCGTDDLIFSIAKLISFLSQGTTLPAGTVIITGTPAGVGAGCTPKVTIREGDEFAVEILPHIGTLFNVFENER